MSDADDIRKMLLDHEGRISRLEAEVKSMNTWMKSIDKKLDYVAESLAYLKGEFQKKNNNHHTESKKQYWSIIAALVTNMALLVAIVFELIIK